MLSVMMDQISDAVVFLVVSHRRPTLNKHKWANVMMMTDGSSSCMQQTNDDDDDE